MGKSLSKAPTQNSTPKLGDIESYTINKIDGKRIDSSTPENFYKVRTASRASFASLVGKEVD